MVAVTKNPKYKTYARGEAGSITSPSIGTPKNTSNPVLASPPVSGLGQSIGVKSPKDVFFGAVPPALPQSQQLPLTPKEAFFGGVSQPLPQSIDQSQANQAPATMQNNAQSFSAPQNVLPQQQGQTPGFSQPGQMSAGIDKSQSYIGQTGQYQYDFWSSEGQKERVLNALDTMSPRLSSTDIMGQQVPVASQATTVLVDALNVANVLNAGANVLKMLGTMNKVGSLALITNGAKELASTIPEASGILPWLAKTGIEGSLPAGQVVANTANAATKINFITKLLTMKGLSKNTLGGLILGSGAILSSFSGATTVRKDVSDFIKDSGELAVKLREVGLDDMADELAAQNKDLKDGFDVYLPYIPLIGKNFEEAKIQDYRDQLNAANLKYDGVVKAEKEKKIAEALAADKQAADAKAAAEQLAAQTRRDQQVQDSQTQRDQELEDQSTKRDQQLADRADQRVYDQQQTSMQSQAQYSQDATSLESSGGSTLTFGLLNTGGGSEFVDKDKAAKLYFGKVYDELTPDQQMLLNLLKKGK